MLTDEQARAVDAFLTRCIAYLERLERRVKAKGVREPHPLPKWIEHAKWSLDGLRSHFGEWARGQDPTLNGAKQVSPRQP
jgi:hypothetical protein